MSATYASLTGRETTESVRQVTSPSRRSAGKTGDTGTYERSPQYATGITTTDLSPRSTESAPQTEPTSSAGESASARTLRLKLWRESAAAFQHIAIDVHVREGEPTITGTSITVEEICGMVASGLSPEAISEEFYCSIRPEDVREALHFASRLAAYQ